MIHIKGSKSIQYSELNTLVHNARACTWHRCQSQTVRWLALLWFQFKGKISGSLSRNCVLFGMWKDIWITAHHHLQPHRCIQQWTLRNWITCAAGNGIINVGWRRTTQLPLVHIFVLRSLTFGRETSYKQKMLGLCWGPPLNVVLRSNSDALKPVEQFMNGYSWRFDNLCCISAMPTCCKNGDYGFQSSMEETNRVQKLTLTASRWAVTVHQEHGGAWFCQQCVCVCVCMIVCIRVCMFACMPILCPSIW